MDRDELDERIRSRRPGDAAFRRGMPVDDASAEGDASRPQGYVPFEPEPEDLLASREPDPAAAPRYVDNTPADFEVESEQSPGPPPAERLPVAPPYVAPAYAPPTYAASEFDEADGAAPGYDRGGEQEQPYPYAYARRGGNDGRRGGGALPIIGFVALCALALAVGAVLAGVFGGAGNVAQTTPSPTVAPSSSNPLPTAGVSAGQSESSGASVTPEPTDGPITFADGTVISLQPCATRDMSFDGCDTDGSVVSGDVWVWIGFNDALGTDTFTLALQAADQTIDQQETVLGDVLDCAERCSGYLIGAAYRDLDPGEYELVIRRNGDFADRATFRVEG